MSSTEDQSVATHHFVEPAKRFEIQGYPVKAQSFILDPLQHTEPGDDHADFSSTSLLSVELTNFWFDQLPEEIYTFVKLQALVVEGNYKYKELQTLSGSIGQLKDLMYLDCNDNALRALPSEIGQLRQLRYLDCSRNVLNALPESIGELQLLNYLNCSHQYGMRILMLPDTISKLKRLSYLDCSHTKLVVLPDTICQLENLKHLKCQRNNLVSLPNTIGQLQELSHRSCNTNELSTLPESIVQLQWLQYLDCSGNRLARLPVGIINLKWLEHLDCSENLLTELPDDLTLLRKLTHFNCSQNRRLYVLPDFGKQLKELNCLYCSPKMCISAHRARHTLPGCKVRSDVNVGGIEFLYDFPLPFHMLVPRPQGSEPTAYDANSADQASNPDLPNVLLFSTSRVSLLDVSFHRLLYRQYALCEYVSAHLKHAVRLQLKDGLPNAGGHKDRGRFDWVNLEVWADSRSRNEECFQRIKEEGVDVVHFTCGEKVQTVSGTPLPKSAKHLSFCGNHTSFDRDNTHTQCPPRQAPFCFAAFSPSLFPHLSKLVLRSLALKDIPASLYNARSLRHLDVGQNMLSRLRPEIKQLVQLEFLSVANNQIFDVSLALTELPHLHCLDVTGNLITELPEPTAACNNPKCTASHTGLQELRADGNRLTNFPPWVGRLKELPWKNESALNKIPTIIIEQGKDAVLRYLGMLERSSATNQRPTTLKVGLLGESSAGKTSLAMSLFRGSPYLVDPKDRTKGMTRFVHNIKKQPLAIIDIGGHSDYFYLHEAVLLGPAVVVITVNLALDVAASTKVLEKADEFYLAILSRARGNLKIVAVGTHADECGDTALEVKCKRVIEHLRSLEDRYRRQLQTVAKPRTICNQQLPDYPSVGEEVCVQQAKRCLRSIPAAPNFVVATSAKTLQGYEAVSEVLADCATDLLCRMPQTLPVPWLALDAWLDWLISGDTPLLMISTHDILAMFPPSEFGPTYQEALKNVRLAMAYMASIGKIVFFADTPVLQDAVFLSPQLLVKLFSVIHQHDLQKSVLDASTGQHLHGAMPENERLMLIEHAAIFKQSGILSKELISQLWQMAGQSGHRLTVDLLCQLIERLDLGQEMDLVPSADGELTSQSLTGSSGKGIFLPFYAEISGPSMPQKATEFYSQFIGSLVARNDIVLQYSFPMYLPQGLWERCLVRQFRQLRRMWMWRNGGFGDDVDSNGCLVIRRSIIRQNDSWLISLHVCGIDEASSWKLALQCCMEVEAILQEWRGLPVSRSVACPHCVDDALRDGRDALNSAYVSCWFPVDNWLLGKVARQRPRRVLCPGDRDVDVTDVHRVMPTEG